MNPLKMLLATLSLTMAVAGAASADKLTDLTKKQFGTDTRVKTRQIKEGVCGGDGPSTIVEVQIRKLERYVNNKTQRMDLRDKWQTVKTYGIPKAELAKANARLIDSEACME